MTPHYRKLFWATKTYARANNIRYVWFFRGKIWMRVKEGDKAIIVKSEKDLSVTGSSPS